MAVTTDWSASDAEICDQLAQRVNCNGLSRCFDAEKFLSEKDEIARDLRKLAKRLRGGARASPLTSWRPPGVKRSG